MYSHVKCAKNMKFNIPKYQLLCPAKGDCIYYQMDAKDFTLNAQIYHANSLIIFAVKFQICMSTRKSEFIRSNVHKGLQSHIEPRSAYLH